MSAGVESSGADAAKKLSSGRKRGGVVEMDFNLANSEGVNTCSRRDGGADFKFLARDTVPPYVDNRPCSSPANPNCANTKLSSSSATRKSANSATKLPSTARRWREDALPRHGRGSQGRR